MYYQQKQLSKQSQLVDQNFSNGIMLNALSALENLAIFMDIKEKLYSDTIQDMLLKIMKKN